MSAIPLHDLDEVATKGDLAVLRSDVIGEIASLRADFKSDIVKLALVLIAGFLGVIASLIGVGLR